jgi:RNA polymerase sigma factor (TIGR02999 family)
MRRVLVDHARRRQAAKRGGASVRVPLQEDLSDTRKDAIDLIDLHDALLDLARVDARQARVSELRLLGGLSVEEVAHVLGVSPRTVKGDWRSACAWLRPRLSQDRPG